MKSDRINIGEVPQVPQRGVNLAQLIDTTDVALGHFYVPQKKPAKKASSADDVCYPFNQWELNDLIWATYNLPQAAASIVTAENAATDDTSLRPRNNAYIRECLAAIRRRRESVERATDLFDAGIGGEALDALCEASTEAAQERTEAARRAAMVPLAGPEAIRAAKGPQTARKAASAGRLWSG